MRRKGHQLDSRIANVTSTKGSAPFTVFTDDIKAPHTAFHAKDTYSAISDKLVIARDVKW